MARDMLSTSSRPSRTGHRASHNGVDGELRIRRHPGAPGPVGYQEARMRDPRLLAVAISVSLLACGSAATAGPAPGIPAALGATHVIVLDEAQMQRRQGSLLSTLTGFISQIRVRGRDGCPNLEIRGRTSFQGRSDPTVYLDGTMAANTCLLEQLRSEDVSRVEVYPMGITSRPGYRNSSGGLILVFSREARQ
jgi:hypothetical protein